MGLSSLIKVAQGKNAANVSFEDAFLKGYGIRIPSEKKRTLYRYDLSSWLKRYELSVEVR